MSQRHACMSQALNVLIGFCSWTFFSVVLQADPPTTHSVDSSFPSSVDSEWFSSQPETDALLFRRLSLDLRLVVPTLAELDEYLKDESPDRWTRWVERFLDDPLHRERMVDWWDKTLMQRRPAKHVERTKWIAYLRQLVDDRKTVDAIAKDLVSSVWWNASQRAKQRFFLDREGDSHGVARDIGRVFFGRDMQCAQCHDHPQVNDYLQIDYHGLLGFVAPSALVEAKYKDDKGAEQKLQMYVERAASDAPFESVFDKGVVFRSGARVPGRVERNEAYRAPDQRYQPSPPPESFEGVPAPPIASRREAFLHELSPPNRVFATNWANRAWAMMFGRGIVHPLDMHHADNPPSNPPLLEALTDSFIASGYDLRPLIRQIALSEAYRRTNRLPIESQLTDKAVISLPTEKIQSIVDAIQHRKSTMHTEIESLKSKTDETKNGMDTARSEWHNVQKERVAIRLELDKAEAKFNDLKKKSDESEKNLSKASKLLADLSTKIKLLEEATKNLEQAKSLVPGEDAELAQAIATSKAKTESSKAALPATEKSLADATVAKETAVANMEKERGPLLQIAKQLEPIELKLQTADRLFVEARLAWQRSQSDLMAAQIRSADDDRILVWFQHSKDAVAMEQEYHRYQESIERHNRSLVEKSEKIAASKQRMLAANVKLSEIEARRTIETNKLNTLDSEMTLLKSAIQSLENTISLVESSDSFTTARRSLENGLDPRQKRRDMILSEVMAIELELSNQQTASSQLAADMANLESEKLELCRLLESDHQEMANQKTSLQKCYDACELAKQQVLNDRQKSFDAAPMRSLSPEQLGWSVLRATKVLDNYISTEAAAIEKESPLPQDATNDQKAERQLKATRHGIDKLRGNVDVFANLYASGVGQSSDEFFASPDQALFMSNGGSVFAWSAANGENVTGMSVKQSDTREAARLMVRAILSREPVESERNWISDQLTQAADKKNQVAQELVWSLLTSSEFRVYP